MVPQDTVLFNQDIRYNIRYGNQEADDVDVLEAAEAADIHNRILSFPEGKGREILTKKIFYGKWRGNFKKLNSIYMYKEAINATTVAWTCKQELIFLKN